MRRGAKPGKAKVKARLPVAHKSPKTDAAGRRELEKRLAESLEREKAKDGALAEALEQQTATSEILRVISSSPSDAQPVFETIVASAGRLCGAESAVVYRFEGGTAHFAAHYNLGPEALKAYGRRFPRPLHQTDYLWRIADGSVLNSTDIEQDARMSTGVRADYRSRGARSAVWVPMVRGGQALGAISVTHRDLDAFSRERVQLLKTFADQAVIAIENVRLFNETKEALEQQTAASEILRVISSSPSDVQPVFEAIIASAVQLCDATFGGVFRFHDGQLHVAALSRVSPEETDAYHLQYPRPPHRNFIMGRAFLDGRPVHVEDVFTVPDYDPQMQAGLQSVVRYRSVLAVPILRDGVAIGVVGCARREVKPFTPAQIELLKTFADQAVIAIENVRLFTELERRNRDLTATSEILRVISSSPTDVQPVFDTIVRSAVALCGGLFSTLFQFDGDMLHILAAHNTTPEALEVLHSAYPARPTRALVAGRAILERAVVHIPDVELEPESQQRAIARAVGWRSALIVPMLREGAPMGVITVGRVEAGPFSNNQIELLKTFADQAVIAIENVRLFTELQASNRELTTALDQQTATSDILRMISQSQTNVQPVFDAIVASAVRLLRADTGVLSRIAGDQIELAALRSSDAAGDAALRATFPRPLESETPHAQVIRERAPLNIVDTQRDPRLSEAVHMAAGVRGIRSQVVVPLLRHDEAIGAIGVSRREAGGFTDDEIALLRTFADQAVIAIENVRLFTELEGRNRDLTATSEVLKVISRSTTDLQPVLDTVAENAAKLCGAHLAFIFRFDGVVLRGAASYNASLELKAFVEQNPIAPGRHSGTARAALERRTVHISDVLADREYTYGAKQVDPVRTILGVPILKGNDLVGVIMIYRLEVKPFSQEQIALVETFADQAVIAIENVRLFTELQARTGELTRSVEKLTALGEVSQTLSSTLDVETVLDTIVLQATQLAGADGCAISEYDDASEVFHVRAAHGIDAALVGTLRAMPLRKGEGVMGRAAEMREPIQVADIAVPGAYESHVRDVLIGAGFLAILSVPLVREEQIIGSLSLLRKARGEFSPEVIEVLKTFATQSALAIQNARLFGEIADKSAQLEAASRHKSAFLANMSHELRTPLNAIIGFSEVLVDRMFGELNDKQDEYLKDIYASGQHLLSLINDILDLSKIEAGRMELEVSDFDLPSAIDNALTLVRERASRRGITLGHAVDHRLGPIRGDERKVKQVLLNLLSNALKFTPEGGRIDVGVWMQDRVAEVSVADTGIGIAPEDQEAVFEEFRQVGTADKKVEGTGLGLALSRRFIELHGGRIWVKSQLGHGSTFTFTLPVRREG